MRLLIAIIACLLAPNAMAGNLTFRLGPPHVGGGGPNPVSIPPVNPIDWEITWVNDRQWETNIGIFPGPTFGKRWSGPDGLYVSGGGGIILSRNGVGLGPYTGFGADIGAGKIRFNVEFKQAIGFTSNGPINPYALRLGATIVF